MAQPSEDDIRKMSPEELQEYQKKNCLFCHIIEGRVASKKVYEDDTCIGILDINPANPGHVLLIPKGHFSVLPLMPAGDYSKMIVAAKRVSTAILRSVKAEGINMFIANGAVAGQKSPHTMVHIIPRKEGDNITAFNLPENEIEAEDQQRLQRMIRPKVNDMFGIVEEPLPEPARKAPQDIPAPVRPGSVPAGKRPDADRAPVPKPQSDADKRKADLDKISGLFR